MLIVQKVLSVLVLEVLVPKVLGVLGVLGVQHVQRGARSRFCTSTFSTDGIFSIVSTTLSDRLSTHA